ncbi:MAG TPA: hypothetical protein DCR44_07475 [Acholeplasmatales bacterium]|nr:MAG: hypothetical protein A2Y16_02125 [Tenericutes bacterium GWF2_57_13]HAQ57215.1 hypothetical protein [Acholeplasmatales bacterium]
MRKLIEEHLLERVVPFWTALLDHECGGFYGHVGADLRVARNADKGLVQQARHLYAFSRLENHYRDGRFLPFAEASYRFLTEKLADPVHGGYWWIVKRNGKPVDRRKVIYGQGFAVYALAEYYKATRDETVLAAALEAFHRIERIALTPYWTYMEEFDEAWSETPPALLTDGVAGATYSTNTLLHLLEAFANLASAAPYPDVVDAVWRLLHVFLGNVRRTDGSLVMYFDEKFVPLPTERSYGHEIEAAWLITEAAQTIDVNDAKIAAMTRSVAESILKESIGEDGRVCYGTLHDGRDPTAVWWVQAEAMTGFYDLYCKSHNPAALHATEQVLAFCQAHLADKRPGGEWFWSVDRDGRPNRERGVAELWKSSYHLVRSLVELMERIDGVK